MPPLRLISLSLATTLLWGCQSHDARQLNNEYQHSQTFTEGVPGGTVVEAEEMQALVTAINRDKRTFTLMDRSASKRTFQAPADMRNFEQLKVGDKVWARVVLERIIYLRQPNDVDSPASAASLLATAPENSKPGLLAADTVEITAIIKGMDSTLRTATLTMPDGSERVVKVRPDVEMKNEYLGQVVVLRMTSAIAISVEPQ